eukprot:Opistho-2@86516
MSIVLKIAVQLDQVLTKSFEFQGYQTMEEVAKSIRDKMKVESGNRTWKDHMLYWPEKKKWFELQKTIDFYDLKAGTLIEYKKKHRPLKVRFLDGALKTFLIDDSQTVKEIVVHICQQIGLKGPEELSLLVDTEPGDVKSEDTAAPEATSTIVDEDREAEVKSALEMAKMSDKEYQKLTKMIIPEGVNASLRTNEAWLSPTESIASQGLGENDRVLMKYRYFNKLNLTRNDSVRLNLLYHQAKTEYLNGELNAKETELCKLAAMQCQILFGDFNEGKHTLNFLDASRKSILPRVYKLKPLVKKINSEHQSLGGASEIDAKYCFVKLWSTLPSFGVEWFTCMEKNTKRKALLGVSHDKVFFAADGNKEVENWALAMIQKWTEDTVASMVSLVLAKGRIQLIFPGKGARTLCQCLQGNIEVIVIQRNQTDWSDDRGAAPAPAPTGGKDRKSKDLTINSMKDDMYWSEKFSNPLDDHGLSASELAFDAQKAGVQVTTAGDDWEIDVSAASVVKKAIALYDYNAVADHLLSIHKGEKLDIISESADGWWEARNEAGNTGAVPKNYVKMI